MIPEQISELERLIEWRKTAREHLRDDFPEGAKWRHEWSVSNNTLLEAAPELLADWKRMREALEFYRDNFVKHYKRGPTGIDHSTWKPTEALLDDCGERARAALEQP